LIAAGENEMAGVRLTQLLREEYENLFNQCRILPERAREVDATVAKLMASQSRYEEVASRIGIPWYFVAVIHNMEASLNFSKHLHNGDTLSKRTTHVPAGHPKKGSPPFTWEESAADALQLRGLDGSTDWSLGSLLYELEGYNGWGYRKYHSHVLSPYLWCFSEHYTSGKYVADGRWSDSAKSRQVGAAVLLRRMSENRQIEFDGQPAPVENDDPLLVRHANKKPRSAEQVRRAEALQVWLNTFPGIFVKVDGVPGDRTSHAFRQITGHYLPGDPRAA
tara:strand:- start:44606 stop:45439 length:834 start_codon:yes stop_codon:yes gene_type:complete